jgi:hypothetical protein
MAKNYRGSAGAMPERKSFGGGGGYDKPKGYRLYEPARDKEGNPIDKKVVDFKCDKGEKNRRVVVLDKDLDYAVRMHKSFKLDGTWANMVVCRSNMDDTRGCPLCEALERRYSWLLCATVIDQDGWTSTEGKNKGVNYPNLRRLLLIPDQVAETFETIGEELEGGWRGAQFKVSRSSTDKSLRIGDNWREDFRAGKMSEQDMIDEFEESSERYGLSAESFAQPIDYDELLKPKSYEELLEIANEYKKSIAKPGAVGVSRPAALSEAGGTGDADPLPF